MRAFQAKRIAQQIDDVLWFLEHPETVTLGRRAKREPISVPSDYQTVDADRGGGLTWHGPGQLTAYLIFDWNRPHEKSVAKVIERIEQWLINAAATLSIVGETNPAMHGMWIGSHKVASIGLSFSHWVTRHGFTINYSTPIGRVEQLAGCALPTGTTTSIAQCTGISLTRQQLEAALLSTLSPSLDRSVTDEWSTEQLLAQAMPAD